MKLMIKQGVILSALVTFSFFMWPFASRNIFVLGATGWIKQSESPFLVPENVSVNQYCHRNFKTTDGAIEKEVSHDNNKRVYCSGPFWKSTTLKEEEANIPFKLIGNEQAIYWINPHKQVIGSRPNLSEANINKHLIGSL